MHKSLFASLLLSSFLLVLEARGGGHGLPQKKPVTVEKEASRGQKTKKKTVKEDDLPLYITADAVRFDEATEILHAEGNVEISEFLPISQSKHASFFKKSFSTESTKQQGQERYLRADHLTYDKKTRHITVLGNVLFKDEQDNIIYADVLSFDANFSNGFIRHMRILLSDEEGRLTAQKASRNNGQKNIFNKATYSPCKICKDFPTPLWQLRAQKIMHDQTDEEISYQHVMMDLYGVPILYAPYFFHPDPSVKRKSGVLFPTFNDSKTLGLAIKLPYYYVIDRHSDLTLTPILTSKQGPIMMAEYKKRMHRGEISLAGSVTQSKGLNRQTLRAQNQDEKTPPHTRFHLNGNGRLELNDTDLVTIKLNRASDTTYLRRYTIVTNSSVAQDKNLTSEAKIERFKEGTYAAVKGYAFQTDRPKTTPLVFPLARFMHQKDPGRFGEIVSVDFHAQNLARNTQIPGIVPQNSQRFVGQGRMYLPYIHRSGQMVEWESLMRGDLYHINGFSHVPTWTKSTYTTGRVFPQSALTWRLPLIQRGSYGAWMLEPLMQLNLSPSGLNPQKIPNEDSRLSELDDTSLFFLSRMNGFDRTDTGQRFVYGVNNGFYGPKNMRLFWFIGQSQRLNRRGNDMIGNKNHTSDYVTRIQIYPTDYFKLHYRGRFTKTGDNRLSEITTNVGKPWFSLGTTYIFVSRHETPTHQPIRQLNWNINTRFHENWRISLSHNQNLSRAQRNSRAQMASLVFENDCFQTSLGIFQTSYRDRDLRPDKGFLIQFSFKNLGTIAPASFSGNMMNTRTL